MVCVDSLIAEDRMAWIPEACRSGDLSGHEQQVMLRVAHQDIQLDAHEAFKALWPEG